MIKPRITSAMAIFWTLASSNIGVSQTEPSSNSVDAQVTISNYERDGTLKSQTHRVSLTTNPIGKFSVVDPGPAGLASGDCGPVPPQQLGTKVDGTVTATSAGLYQIHLAISVSTRGGCSDVGAFTVPIVASTRVMKDAVISSGETVSVPIGSRGGKETLKVEVTLTARK